MPRSQFPGLRERLAQEAARLMIEHGIVDFGLAKRKAAERLGVSSSGALPGNAQIEQCLAERQRLFEPDLHEQHVRSLRQIAVELMMVLEEFEPRLTGSVLAGTATINSAVEIHLFSASIEAVADSLAENRLQTSHCERRYRFGGGRIAVFPGFRVPTRGEIAVLPVFPEHGVREAPLSSVDQKPMQRATLPAVARLLELVPAAS